MEAGANPIWLYTRDGVHPEQVINLAQSLHRTVIHTRIHIYTDRQFRVASWPNVWEETGGLKGNPLIAQASFPCSFSETQTQIQTEFNIK